MKNIFKIRTIRSKLFLSVMLCILILITTIFTLDKYFSEESDLLTSEYYFKSKTQECAIEISKIFEKNFVQCFTIANELSDIYDKTAPLNISESDIDRIASTILRKNQTISGVKIILEPVHEKKLKSNDSTLSDNEIFEFDLHSLRLKYLEPPKSYYWFAYDLNGSRNNQRVAIENIESEILYKTISDKLRPIILPPKDYKIQDQEIRLITIAVPVLSRNKFCGFVAMEIDVVIFYRLLDEIKDFNTESTFTLLTNNNIIVSSTLKNYLSGQDASKLFRNEVINDMSREGMFRYKFLNESSINTTTIVDFGRIVEPWRLHFQTRGATSWLSFNEHDKRFYLTVVALVLSFLIIIYLILKYYFEPFVKIREQAEILSAGQSIDINQKFNTGTEVQSLFSTLQLIDSNIEKMIAFAENMRKGELTTEFSPLSKSDALGNSLLMLRTNLNAAKEEEEKYKYENEIRFWKSKGITSFADIIRKNNSDVGVLSYKIISALVEYLKINQGGLFVINNEDENDIVLELQGAYAYNRQKHHKKTVKLGEGLIGACALEKKTLLLDKIPEDYIEITSGLGKTHPKYILLAPLISEQKMMGVIELASMNQFSKYEIDFIEEIAEMIASSINNVKINQKTNSLLEQSQLQSDELSTQEEELRQNIEELQAIKEEVERRNDEIKNKNYYYEQLIDAIPYFVSVTDNEGKWTYINKILASYLDVDRKKIIGKPCSAWGKDICNTEKCTILSLISKKKYQVPFKHHDRDFITNGAEIRDLTNTKVGHIEVITEITEVEKLKIEKLNLTNELKDLRMVFENSAIVAELNSSENITFASKIFLETTKYSHDEVIGNKLSLILPPIDLKMYDNIWNIVSRGEIYRGEIKIMTKHASDKWLFATLIPLKDKQGLLQKVFFIAFDNTEQKNIEFKFQRQSKKLLQKERELETAVLKLNMKDKEFKSQTTNFKRETKMLNSLIDNMPYRIVFKDRNSIIQKANLAAIKNYNLKSVSEIIGKTDFNFISKEIADKHYESEKQIILSNKPILNYQEEIAERDGSRHWFSSDMIPFSDSDGIVTGCFIITKEITRQKYFNFENVRLNNDLLLLINHFSAFTYIVDSDWYVLEAKGKGEKTFELFGSAFVGHRLLEFPEIASKLPNEEAIESINDISFEWIMKNKEDEMKFYHKLVRNELIPNEWYGIAVRI